MALSDEERKRLEVLEQELASSDPDLDRTLQTGVPGGDRTGHGRLGGVLTVIAALALVIAGIARELTILGVVGFLLMIAGTYWYLNGFRLPGRPGMPSWYRRIRKQPPT